MSIYYYRPDEHPAGFIGYRVCVSMGKGEKQEYFPSSGLSKREMLELHFKAATLDNKWNKERKMLSRIKKDSAEPRNPSRYTTGVKGISLRRVDHYTEKDTRFYYTVACQHLKTPYRRSFRIDILGMKTAWFKAVQFYAQCKKIQQWEHLLNRKHSIPRRL